MRPWLSPLMEALARGEAAMLVHVVELKGSGPREPGARMLVTENATLGTIGGGELERSAILKARGLMQTGRAGLVRQALGPELNQCCGGSMTLAFEPFAPADRAWLRNVMLAAEDPIPVFRSVRIENTGDIRRDWKAGSTGPDFAVEVASSPPPPRGEGVARQRRVGGGADRALHVRESLSQPSAYAEGDPLPTRGRGFPRGPAESITVSFRERMNPQAQALWLFGAGHVGKAVARALQPLGFAMTWIDGRAGELPDPPLAGVRQLALAMPELIVDEAPSDTVFLVMTHSHPLDEAICDAILRCEDFAYLGLIGSDSKRARFVKRLAEAGIPRKQLKRLVCPIGLPGIESKEPAAIAASLAADLLMRRERNLLTAKGAVLNER